MNYEEAMQVAKTENKCVKRAIWNLRYVFWDGKQFMSGFDTGGEVRPYIVSPADKEDKNWIVA